MARCPECGAEVEEWASVCHVCEATLADGQQGRRHEESDGDGASRQGQGARGRGAQGQNEQGRGAQGTQGQGVQGASGGGGQTGRGGQQRGGRRGDQQARGAQGREGERARQSGRQSQARRRSRADGSDGGLSRRALLAGGAGIGALAVAGGGYLGYQRFFAESSEPSGSKSTAREFLNALDEGDVETAESLVHSDTPEGFSFDASSASDTSIDIEAVREVPGDYDFADGDDVTVVEADVTATQGEQSREGTFVLELHTESGEWKVWLMWSEAAGRPDPSQVSTPDPAPTASFQFDWEGASGSTGTLTITFASGEAITASNLLLLGGNPAADNLGDAWNMYASGTGPDDDVLAGDSITIDPVASDATVSLVWQTEDGGRSRELSEWTGPDA